MTGDWLIPRMIRQPTTHKPPLTNWLISLAMIVCRSQAEWVCRSPSVLAALGTALLTAWLGTRWYGRRVGLLAGFVQKHDHVDKFLQRIRSLPPGKHHIVTHGGQVTTLKAVGQVETIADCPPRRSHLPKLVYLVLNMRDGSLSRPVLNKSP